MSLCQGRCFSARRSPMPRASLELAVLRLPSFDGLDALELALIDGHGVVVNVVDGEDPAASFGVGSEAEIVALAAIASRREVVAKLPWRSPQVLKLARAGLEA